ncbi:unnamed protein product [Meloidogyne enterolobii]|uniref:Uncharacterized protein n=1 Tax=Meloidogyne enterolobii TaxID=390850 RepID=A0ACB0YJG4_MELEN
MVLDSDIIKFLIASDIHAGYGENKQYIGNDSFESLREVLSNAKEAKVDFVLLAGDLFHENHPSRETQLKVVRLLRTYCTKGEKPDLDFVSDPTINFQHSNFPSVNYLDDNLCITVPIFTIHGNHDDLSGKVCWISSNFYLAFIVLIKRKGRISGSFRVRISNPGIRGSQTIRQP